ncbi:MAG: hypothetical protein FGF51_03795 [Candidatus Brockarchaeota archaeon]|nr:hypothetical protein [Candidatus Brockarchaeota archaeon]
MTHMPPRLLAKRVASLSILAALAISSNYVLIGLPNVKLMDAIVFASSMAMGLKFGAILAMLIWMVYGTLNPYGFNLPTLMAVMLSEMIYVLFSKIPPALGFDATKTGTHEPLVLASIGLFSTLIYDLATNAFTGYLFYGSVLMGLITMNFPLPMSILHELSNALFFPIVTPVICRILKGDAPA